MVTKVRRYAIAGIGGLLVLSAILVAARVSPAPPSSRSIPAYPPNARQLIAAGLTGRPAGSGVAGPIVVDLVLVDGTRTTVLFHATGPGDAVPPLSLSDDRGRTYQPSGTSVWGSGLAMMRRPGGWQGVLWGLARLIPFLDANRPAMGYASFPSLPPTVRAAIVQAGRGAPAVRVPLHLAALGTMARTVVFQHSVSRQGLLVTLKEVSRGPGSARIVYTVDAPVSSIGSPDAVLRDGLSRELSQLGGSTGTCGIPAGHGARMRCDETALITPPPSGTLMRLIVTAAPAPGSGMLHGAHVVMPFRMP